MDTLTGNSLVLSNEGINNATVQSRLRQQMQHDALHPLKSDDDDNSTEDAPIAKSIFTPETIEEAAQFLRLNVSVLFYGIRAQCSTDIPSL